MEHQKELNLLNESNDSKFMTRKWKIDNDNSKWNYAAINEISYNTENFKSNLCDYNDAYILVTGDINVIANKIPNHDKYIITPEFNKLTAENYTVRLKQANLMTKTNLNMWTKQKLRSFNRKMRHKFSLAPRYSL